MWSSTIVSFLIWVWSEFMSRWFFFVDKKPILAFYEFNEFSVHPERRQSFNNQFLLLGHWLPRRDAETGAGKKHFQLPSLTTRTMPKTRTTFRRISWLTITISRGMRLRMGFHLKPTRCKCKSHQIMKKTSTTLTLWQVWDQLLLAGSRRLGRWDEKHYGEMVGW